jgi:predicted dehydrogenase
MTTTPKVRIAIVGLGFGAEFIPIYQRHPNAEMYAICRRNREELDACGDRFGVKVRYTPRTFATAWPPSATALARRDSSDRRGGRTRHRRAAL